VGKDGTEGDVEAGVRAGAGWAPSMVANTELGRGTGMGAVHVGRGWGHFTAAIAVRGRRGYAGAFVWTGRGRGWGMGRSLASCRTDLRRRRMWIWHR
jgi:hypothetical protein